DACRADRLERRLLQPGRGPVRALVEARRARSRDGGVGAVHRRRATRRAGRVPAHGQRHRRRRRVQADHRRGAPRRGRPDDARRARDGHGRRPPLKTVFLVNPASANGSTGRRWPEIARRAAAAGISGDALLSQRPGELTELTRSAIAEGATLLVVVGGDGTVHEVVNGAVGAEGVELAVLPRGTGKDFVRSLRIPSDVGAALGVARDGRPRTIDLGSASYRSLDGSEATAYFANFAGAGISGAIARRANSTSKALGGRISFLAATVAVFASWESATMTVQIDDDRRSGN